MEADNKPASTNRSPIQIGAAVAVLGSAFLPWIGSNRLNAFDLSAAFLWDLNSYRSSFSIGILVLIAGAVLGATLLVDRLAPYRRHAGVLVVAIATVWQLQTFRILVETYGDILHPLRDMLRSALAMGPWVAFAAGVTVALKR
jgi:hypothetical protein